MHRYKAVIAYDGTEYNGWQQQKDLPTIAQALQDSFAYVFGTSIAIAGVSRTDAGVHARGQIATFTTHLDMQAQAMKWAWNNRLPAGIHLRELERVAYDHNIYNNVAYKIYVYHVFTRRPSPFKARYGWYFRKNISLPKLQHVVKLFLGTHDFRSFCSENDREDTVRTIDTITIQELKHGTLRITIKGPAFLRYMIRRLVGAALAAASNNEITVDTVREILERKNPCHPLPNAPAKGLVLWRVVYTTT